MSITDVSSYGGEVGGSRNADGTHWLRVDAMTAIPICSWSDVRDRGDARGIAVVALGECEAKEC